MKIDMNTIAATKYIHQYKISTNDFTLHKNYLLVLELRSGPRTPLRPTPLAPNPGDVNGRFLFDCEFSRLGLLDAMDDDGTDEYWDLDGRPKTP